MSLTFKMLLLLPLYDSDTSYLLICLKFFFGQVKELPSGQAWHLPPTLMARSRILVLVWLAGSTQHSGAHRQMRRAIPLGSGKAGGFQKRTFPEKQQQHRYNSINTWISSWSLACRARLKGKIASDEDWQQGLRTVQSLVSSPTLR